MLHDLFLRMRATWRPDMYHGWGRTRRYFEGWYSKVVSADGGTALALIPGISFPVNGPAQAFIQVMYGSENRSEYHPFDTKDFRPSTETFELDLAGNVFSAGGMRLDLPGIRGEVRFLETSPWPRMLGAPGIMGWYSFVPFMECFHGVVSLHHRLEGALEIGGKTVDFTGGQGYIEKDWGRSFPRAYVWMHTNTFDQGTPASLLASVAHIPWLGTYFIGFIGGFWLDGRLFRFATYTGAKKYLELAEDSVTLVFKNPKTELRMFAEKAPGTALMSPLSGAMTGKINESLQARIQVELLENGKRVFAGTGHPAGLEIAGDTAVLLR